VSDAQDGRRLRLGLSFLTVHPVKSFKRETSYTAMNLQAAGESHFD